MESIINTLDSLINEFEKIKPYFYDETDYRRGHIVSTDRSGDLTRFNLITLIIAG